jgi:hypothetical protein
MPQGSTIQEAVSRKEYVVGEYLGKGQLGVVYGLLEADGKTPMNQWVVKEPLGRLTKADRLRFDRELEVLEKIKQAAEKRLYPNPVPQAYKGQRQDPVTGQWETLVLLERAEAQPWRLELIANDTTLTRDNEVLLQAAIQYTYLLEILHETDEVNYFCRDRTALDLLWHPEQKRLLVLDWNVVEPITAENKAEAWADGQHRFGALWYELLIGERLVVSADPDRPASPEGIARWARVSEGMRGILICCLASNPHRRYPSVQELRQALMDQAQLLDEGDSAHLIKLGEALESETQKPVENRKPEHQALDGRELERRALAAFDLAHRRGAPGAQTALNRMRDFVSGRSLRYLKDGREAASRGNWEKALQALEKAVEEAHSGPEALLPIYRWRLAVQAGQSAALSFTTTKKANVTMLKDAPFKSLEEALESMHRQEWDQAHEPLGRVCAAMEWDPTSSNALAKLRCELDLRQMVKQAYSAKERDVYSEVAMFFEKAKVLLTQIADQDYAEALAQVLPPLDEEALKAQTLAHRAGEIQHYVKLNLSLTHETELDQARVMYETAVELLNRSPLASVARYEELRAKYAPALEALDAADLLRAKTYLPAFQIARQALDKHAAQYPYVAEYLGKELQSSVAQISANLLPVAKTTTAITVAREYLQAAQTAFQGFVYRGPQPPPPALAHFMGALPVLAQGQAHWQESEHKLETYQQKIPEAIARNDLGSAAIQLAQAQKEGLEPFQPGVPVASLTSAVKGVVAVRKLAEASQEHLQLIGNLYQTAKSQEGYLKQCQDQAHQAQAEFEELFLMKDLAAAEASLQLGDEIGVVKYLTQSQTPAYLKFKEDPRFSKRHAYLEKEKFGLDRLFAWQLVARCATQLGGMPPQPLTPEDAQQLTKLRQQDPALHTLNLWLEENRRVASSAEIAESLKPLDALRDHLRQLLLEQNLFKLQSAIDEPLPPSAKDISPLLPLLIRYEKEIWRGIALNAEEMAQAIAAPGEDWIQLDRLANCLKAHDAVFAVWRRTWEPRFSQLFKKCFAAEGYWLREGKGQRAHWRPAKPQERDQAKTPSQPNKLSTNPQVKFAASAEVVNLVDTLLQPYLDASNEKYDLGVRWLGIQTHTNL